MRKFRYDKKYLYWGVTAFLVIAASIVVYLVLSNISGVRSGFTSFTTIFSPFLWGVVIAYLLCPLLNIYERGFFAPVFKRLLRNKPDSEPKQKKLVRGFGVLLSEITLIVLIFVLLWLILPQLYQSVQSIILNANSTIARFTAWIQVILDDYPELESTVLSLLDQFSDSLTNWLRNTILPQLGSLVVSLSVGVYTFAIAVYNIVIGVIVSIYVLYNKELFAAYAKKILYSIFSVEASGKIINGVHFADRTFLGFLSGKIIDSIIIGIICYIGCAIMNMPYQVLVAVIIGFTNIIPFFGPFIGAVPSTIIILTASTPLKCVMFIIFVLLLQQFDGNILGPRILGNSVGIGGFWILFSIIVGGGLFSFAGMLLGVPVFVCVFTLIKYFVNRKLERSGLPTSSEEFKTISYIDPATGEPVRESAEVRRAKRQSKHKIFNFGGKKSDSTETEKPDDGGDEPPE